MLGAIIGDTVGSVYEFNNTKDYNFTLFMGENGYTDDSIMTMAVAWWLLHDKELSYQGLEDAMVTFGQKCPCPMGGYGCISLTPDMGRLHMSHRPAAIHTAASGTAPLCV